MRDDFWLGIVGAVIVLSAGSNSQRDAARPAQRGHSDMSQIISAFYLFDSGVISESGESNYGAYAQARVLNALAEACDRDWSRFPPMLGADGDLFARSQLGETPGQKVLHDLLHGKQGLGRDACDLDQRFASDFEDDVVTYCIPYAVAIGPMARIYADLAHQQLKAEKSLGYLGICRLPNDLPQLARSMNLVAEMTIEQGRITGALAGPSDIRAAGLVD